MHVCIEISKSPRLAQAKAARRAGQVFPGGAGIAEIVGRHVLVNEDRG